MTFITVSQSMVAQMGKLSGAVLFCDEDGNPLGEFTPVSAMSEQRRIRISLPEHLRDSGLPIEDLLRRERDGAFLPHEEVVEQAKQLLKELPAP